MPLKFLERFFAQMSSIEKLNDNRFITYSDIQALEKALEVGRNSVSGSSILIEKPGTKAPPLSNTDVEQAPVNTTSPVESTIYPADLELAAAD